MSTRPINLFDACCSPEQITGALKRRGSGGLLPAMGAEPWRRAAKNPVVQKLMEGGRRRAEEEWDVPPPVLTDELYADFSLSGRRLPFEKVYFERRRLLGRAAVARLLAEDDDPWRGRLEASLLEKFRAVFDEVSWALPAHVNWDREDRTGKDPMQIDLFCAETANLMAEMLDVFGAIIPADLQALVRERLHRAIFLNYLERDFHWMDVTHNWNAVCHQGVVGAALSQVEDPGLLAGILLRMKERLPRFLEGFSADGGCSEGVEYWRYGFGWFSVLNEQLEMRSDGRLSLFEGTDLIRKIARFGPRMLLSGAKRVNFADCEARGSLRPSLLAYLGERLGLEECTAAAEDCYRWVLREGFDWKAERADLFHLLRLILFCPERLAEGGSPRLSDDYLPGLSVLVSRALTRDGQLWEFAAKAGHNGEHHNHNDCGSFVLNVDSSRLLVEIGSPEYVHAYFGAGRYEFAAARSLGHSVPLVNGFEQAAGGEFRAAMVSVQTDESTVRIIMDLAACYPQAAGCRKLLRTFLFDKGAGSLSVTDHCELEAPGTLESILICSPEAVSEDGLQLASESGRRVRIRPDAQTVLRSVEALPYQKHDGSPGVVRRLRFTTSGGASLTPSTAIAFEGC